MKLNSIADIKQLLMQNSLRYHSITRQINNYPPHFRVMMNNVNEENIIKIQAILDLGIKNIIFEEIDFY
jgi:hypothetical protein